MTLPATARPAAASAPEAGDDAQTIHRIEAFSDIVIGFCLAEIGLGLSIPGTGATLANLGANVFVFLASFSLVVMLWWNHHRLFKTYLVLTRAALVMNFALLGALVLMLYFLQIGARDITVQGGGPHFFLRLTLLSFAAVYALLAGMFAIGVRARCAALSPTEFAWGIERTAHMFSVAAAFAIVAAALGLTHGSFDVAGLHVTSLEIVLLAMVLWLLVFRRIILPHFVRRLGRDHG
ncbi:MAG: TMEM175 family protein [Candidatus Cybelea sp.]